MDVFRQLEYFIPYPFPPHICCPASFHGLGALTFFGSGGGDGGGGGAAVVVVAGVVIAIPLVVS